MKHFILGLLEFVEVAAKRANRHANEQYAWAVQAGTPFAEDCAFEEMCWTAQRCDELEDAIYTVEDQLSLQGS